MKSNQKGFTLIELLAVIVILAIIALIATPIIINVINDARQKAAVDSAYGVIKSIQLAYSQNQVKTKVIDSNATVTFDGTSTLNFSTGSGSSVVNDYQPQISISGEVPTSGTAGLNISNGNVTLTNAKIGSYYCNTFGSNGNKVCCNLQKDCTSE